jgi:hypothetical protein
MNRLAVWVAQTAVGATAPMALAQATASSLTGIEAGAGLDPDIAAPPPVAIDLILGLERMARGALIQRAKINAPRFNAPRFNAPGPLRHPMRSPRIP